MKIGVFAGCFNPPHNGHYKIVKYLLENGYINKGIIVPAGDNYNKVDLIKYNDRLNMVNILFQKMSSVIISDIEKDGKKYSYEVLDYYHKQFPNDIMYYILGSDNLKEFKTWQNYQYILENYYVITIGRNNDTIDILNEFSDYKDHIIYIDWFKLDCSSTTIRGGIKDNQDVSTNLSEEINNYIKEHHLYMERMNYE